MEAHMRGSTGARFVALFFAILVASLPFAASGSYINSTERITRFVSVRQTDLEVGESGTLRLRIENRYDNNMTNVTLHCEVYKRLDEYGVADLDEEDYTPLFDGGSMSATEEIPFIQNGTQHNITIGVTTHKRTLEGTYLVRFNMTFDYGNVTYNMKSRGYFNDSQWYDATHERNLGYGMINFTKLGVDGVVSEFAISASKHVSIVFFGALVALAAMFCLLALGFYMQDEYGTFPKLEIAYQWTIGKLRTMKRMLRRE
jgi:hypothetical protein